MHFSSALFIASTVLSAAQASTGDKIQKRDYHYEVVYGQFGVDVITKPGYFDYDGIKLEGDDADRLRSCILDKNTRWPRIRDGCIPLDVNDSQKCISMDANAQSDFDSCVKQLGFRSTSKTPSDDETSSSAASATEATRASSPSSDKVDSKPSSVSSTKSRTSQSSDSSKHSKQPNDTGAATQYSAQLVSIGFVAIIASLSFF